MLIHSDLVIATSCVAIAPAQSQGRPASGNVTIIIIVS